MVVFIYSEVVGKETAGDEGAKAFRETRQEEADIDRFWRGRRGSFRSCGTCRGNPYISDSPHIGKGASLLRTGASESPESGRGWIVQRLDARVGVAAVSGRQVLS